MAAEKGSFQDCEIVYCPYLKKYLRLEENCATCSGDWVDVWTGSNTADGGDLLVECEQTLTGREFRSHIIITVPPENLEVDGMKDVPI
jgi:hypothetical protein